MAVLFYYCFIAITVVFHGDVVVAAKKPYKLSLLDLLSSSDSEPAERTACKAASQVVVDIVNSRTDFLADYEIEINFADESYGTLTAQRAIEYIDSFQNGLSDSSAYQSPVIVGSLHSNGCKAMGRFLSVVNAVNINIACNAPFLADRRLYPNLYLALPTRRVLSHALIHFVKDVGRWSRIAIIAYAEDVDSGSAALLHQLAIDNKVEVAHFDYVMDVTARTIENLLVVDVRIIIFFASNSKMIWKFLCQAYNRRITGSRYVFLILGVKFSDPSRLSDADLRFIGCTSDILIKQLQYAFVTAPAMYNNDPSTNSTLGYGTFEFDIMLDAYTNPAARPMDYEFRYLCHDSMLQSLITLDDADSALRKQNLSLRNFSDLPMQVMEVVNRSSLQVDYVGLRTGRVRYNSRGEVDADLVAISQWFPASLTPTFFSRRSANTSGYNYKHYYLERATKVTWRTDTGRPPRDKYSEKIAVEEVVSSFFVVILSFVVIVSCFQFAAFTQIIQAWLVHGACRSSAHVLPISKSIGYVGCVVLNIAAVLFTADSRVSPQAIWEIRIVALILGLSITISSLFSRVAVIWHAVKSFIYKVKLQQRYRQAREMPREQSEVEYSAFFTNEVFHKLERRSLVSISAFFVLSNSYIVNWLLWDPLKCDLVKVARQAPAYNYDEDAMVETKINQCSSSGQTIWISVITVLFIVLLAVGCYFARFIYYSMPSMKKYHGEIGTIYVIMLAVIVNLFGCSLLIGVTSQTLMQHVVASIGSLVISGLTTGITIVNEIFNRNADNNFPASATVTPAPAGRRRTRRRHNNTSAVSNSSNNSISPAATGDGLMLRVMNTINSVGSTTSGTRINLMRAVPGSTASGDRNSGCGTIGTTVISGSVIPLSIDTERTERT